MDTGKREIVNIAIAGYGKIARTHALAVQNANLFGQLPFHMQISCIVTRRPEDVFFPGAVVTDCWEEALQQVDFVDICSENKAHLAAVEKAAQAGVAVYCEKPLSESVENSKKAWEAVAAAGIINGTALNYRYAPCVNLLKRLLAEGRLGNVIEFKGIFYHYSYLAPEKRKSWRTQDEAGGGASLDLGIHLYDLCRYLFGEGREVQSELVNYFSDCQVDCVSRSRIAMEKGITGEIECSRIFMEGKDSLYLKVFCEGGSFLCDMTRPHELVINDFIKGSMTVWPEEGDYFGLPKPAWAALAYNPAAHSAALADFAKKVYGQGASGIGADFKEACLSQILIPVKKP